jgi:hypothetical protein
MRKRAIYVLGNVMVAIGTLRLLDIVWPPEFMPWGFYAAEFSIGLVLVFATSEPVRE